MCCWVDPWLNQPTIVNESTNQVPSFRFTKPWAGPQLTALTSLVVSHEFSAPEQFLTGFSPNLLELDVGQITWGAKGSSGGAGDGSSSRRRAGSAAVAPVCSLGALPADCRLRSLTVRRIECGSSAPAATAAAAAEPPAAAAAADPPAEAAAAGGPPAPAPAPAPPLKPLQLPSPALAADQNALFLRMTNCRTLHLGHVASRRLLRALPQALCLWTGLEELR